MNLLAEVTGEFTFSTNAIDWAFEMDRATFATYIAVWILSLLLIYILAAILKSRLFEKAGVARWKAWVPVYNLWKLFQIGGYRGGWALLPVVTCFSMAAFHLLVCEVYDWTTDKTTAASILLIVAAAMMILFLVKFIQATWSITKKLGKNWVYMLLLLVNIGPSLWLWILALDKSKWDDKLGQKSLAPEMRKKVGGKSKKK